jgi:thiol-disulfide isomerase/thioredoxin
MVYANLTKELAAAQAKHARQLKAAQNDVSAATGSDDKAAARKRLEDVKKDLPGPKFADRFLAFAMQNPEDASAFPAAMTAFRISRAPAAKDNTRGKALLFLQSHFAESPKMKQVVRILEGSKEAFADGLLRQLVDKNPDHRIQGHACKALLAISTRPVEKANLSKMLKEKYADLFPDLSPGQIAPEIVAKDVDGNEVKLSELRGKVVVLDIWTTWCPYCRAMIPHERQMSERLRNRPFAIVSISMDAKKETLANFLAKNKMPWPQWWVGSNSDLAEDWNIEYYPTVFVIDAQGIIRIKGVTGNDLDEAVMALLRQMEGKRKK